MSSGNNLIRYWELPRATDSIGTCCECKHFPNRDTYEETDAGKKIVINCSECKTKMRAWDT